MTQPHVLCTFLVLKILLWIKKEEFRRARKAHTHTPFELGLEVSKMVENSHVMGTELGRKGCGPMSHGKPIWELAKDKAKEKKLEWRFVNLSG